MIPRKSRMIPMKLKTKIKKDEKDKEYTKIEVEHSLHPDLHHLENLELTINLSRLRVPDILIINEKESEAVLKQYCTIVNGLTKDKYFDIAECIMLQMRCGKFLDKYFKLYELPNSEAFGGTPTLIKLISYILVLEELLVNIKKDKRFPGTSKSIIVNTVDCLVEVLGFYICAMCENQREIYPEEGYKVENTYEFNKDLASGVEKGLLGLEGASDSTLRDTARF
eukprot:UN25562